MVVGRDRIIGVRRDFPLQRHGMCVVVDGRYLPDDPEDSGIDSIVVGAEWQAHRKNNPPSTLSVCPVRKAASSEARK